MKQFKGPKHQRGFWGFVAAGVSLLSGVAQSKAGRKSSKAQRRANEAQRQINKLQNYQAKRQFLRQFRQAQAASLVSGIAAGVGLESSRVQGTMSSQRAQADTAVAEFNRMDELGGLMTKYLNQSSRYQQRAATWGMVGNFAQQFVSFSPGGDTGITSPGGELGGGQGGTPFRGGMGSPSDIWPGG